MTKVIFEPFNLPQFIPLPCLPYGNEWIVDFNHIHNTPLSQYSRRSPIPTWSQRPVDVMDWRRNCHFQDVTDLLCVSSRGSMKTVSLKCYWPIAAESWDCRQQTHTRKDRQSCRRRLRRDESQQTAHTHTDRQIPLKNFYQAEVKPSNWARLWVNADLLLHFKMYCRSLLNAGSE